MSTTASLLELAATSWRAPREGSAHDEPPYGPGVQVGETYDYQLYTHCGVEWGRVDGVWWRTQPLGIGTAAPPPGWGDPYDAGQLRLVDGATAVYSGGPGVDIEFERTDLTEAPSLCL